MSLLIAVKSCVRDRDRGDHTAIRETWGKDIVGADLVFFIGDTPVKPWTINDLSEVTLDCPDGYDELPFKTREICRWSVSRGYNWTFLCDTDTYIVPRLLMEYPYQDADYIGIILQEKPRPLTLGKTFRYAAIDMHGRPWPNDYFPWASGGTGYFLSRKAAEYVAAAEPKVWAEDVFVGQVMGELYNQGKVTIKHALDFEGVVGFHFPHEQFGTPYDSRTGWMQEMYEKYQ